MSIPTLAIPSPPIRVRAYDQGMLTQLVAPRPTTARRNR